jgi:DNA modification methylase
MLNPYFQSDLGILYNGDVLKTLNELPNESVDCCITSPPYWASRDYGFDGHIGGEKDFRDYLENLWRIFMEVYRALKPTGSCYVNLGDTYAGSGGTFNKSLLGSKQIYSNSEGIKSGKVKGLKDK